MCIGYWVNKQYNQDHDMGLFVLWLVEDIGQSTLATVLTVKVGSHEDTSSALLGGTLAPPTVDLAIVINLDTGVREWLQLQRGLTL